MMLMLMMMRMHQKRTTYNSTLEFQYRDTTNLITGRCDLASQRKERERVSGGIRRTCVRN